MVANLSGLPKNTAGGSTTLVNFFAPTKEEKRIPAPKSRNARTPSTMGDCTRRPGEPSRKKNRKNGIGTGPTFPDPGEIPKPQPKPRTAPLRIYCGSRERNRDCEPHYSLPPHGIRECSRPNPAAAFRNQAQLSEPNIKGFNWEVQQREKIRDWMPHEDARAEILQEWLENREIEALEWVLREIFEAVP